MSDDIDSLIEGLREELRGGAAKQKTGKELRGGQPLTEQERRSVGESLAGLNLSPFHAETIAAALEGLPPRDRVGAMALLDALPGTLREKVSERRAENPASVLLETLQEVWREIDPRHGHGIKILAEKISEHIARERSMPERKKEGDYQIDVSFSDVFFVPESPAGRAGYNCRSPKVFDGLGHAMAGYRSG